MYLLDTCSVSDFLKDDPSTCRHMRSVFGTNVCVSSFSVLELYYGVAIMQHPSMVLKAGIDDFLLGVVVLSFGAETAIQAAKLRAALKRKGIGVGAYDVLIAATALAHGLTLVSSNEREFKRIPELQVENWRR